MSSNLCTSCRTDFASVKAFDKHRVGVHEYLWSPEREDGRRCLDADEMRAAGLEVDARGRWRLPSTAADFFAAKRAA